MFKFRFSDFSFLSLFFFVGRLNGIFVIEKFKHTLKKMSFLVYAFILFYFLNVIYLDIGFDLDILKSLQSTFSVSTKKKKNLHFQYVPFKSIIAFWYTNPFWLSWCVILLRLAGLTQVLHWLAVALKKSERSAGQGGSLLDCIGGIQSVRFPIFLPYWCLSID